MNVTAMSRDLKLYLLENRGSKLKVDSVQDNSINLMDTDGNMVVFERYDVNMGPMSLCAEPWERLNGVAAGDVVEIEFQGLHIFKNDIHLNVMEVDLYNPFIYLRRAEKDKNILEKRLMIIEQVIREDAKLEGISSVVIKDPNKLNAYARYIGPCLDEFKEELDAGHDDGALALVPNFVGFGPGMTPSTDDFLMGVLLIVYVLNQHGNVGLKEFVQGVPQAVQGRTTTLSEQLLKHAAKGKTLEAYKKVLLALFSPKRSQLKTICRDMLEVVGISGSDFLTGVYYAKDLILNW